MNVMYLKLLKSDTGGLELLKMLPEEDKLQFACDLIDYFGNVDNWVTSRVDRGFYAKAYELSYEGMSLCKLYIDSWGHSVAFSRLFNWNLFPTHIIVNLGNNHVTDSTKVKYFMNKACNMLVNPIFDED